LKKKHQISSKKIGITELANALNGDIELTLSGSATKAIKKCRAYLDKKIKEADTPIYGINTGFGSLYSHHISKEELEKLQENLVKSHACGTGNEVLHDIVRLMLFLKIQSLAYGYSGVQISTVERLLIMYNQNILPRIFEMGSLGASGDLAPLAHLSLPLIGLGEVYYNEKLTETKTVLHKLKLEALHFKAKEGLALLNGTQFMSAYGSWAVIHAWRLITLANTIAALSIDAFDGRIEAFDENVHQIRPQKGQSKVAKEIKGLLNGSQLIKQAKKHVQDPYSFRCVPQVHGASMDAIQYVHDIVMAEVNGVSDNPNIFPDEDKIISAGNFHGQPLALALDFLAIALAELGSISERRTYQLISGSRNLPNYLVANPGINSGLMIPQYTAASLVSQNKQLCTPASVDSIVSSNGQEDHVSMGANAATKLYKLVNNVYSIFAIELLTASQALEFRRPLKSSGSLELLVSNFRKEIPFIEQDKVLYPEIQKAEAFLKNIEIN